MAHDVAVAVVDKWVRNRIGGEFGKRFDGVAAVDGKAAEDFLAWSQVVVNARM
jgi:hypothetical protein